MCRYQITPAPDSYLHGRKIARGGVDAALAALSLELRWPRALSNGTTEYRFQNKVMDTKYLHVVNKSVITLTLYGKISCPLESNIILTR